MKRLASAFVLAMMTTASAAQAQEISDDRQADGVFGPPVEVVAAWENGLGDLLPGPPAWVIEMRTGTLQDRDGAPPWIAARHAQAGEAGLPGPPAEVIGAWQNGEGNKLPGPPAFVREFFSAFWGSR